MVTFKEFGLNSQILKALTEIGFESPTQIQSEAIPYLLDIKKDLIALAQTGTGKTAAFSLPIINQIDTDDHVDNNLQTLILCPTRELAIQIAKDINSFVKYLPEFKVASVYGGERIDKQIRVLKKKPQIVVGTPGRINDMIRRRLLKLESIKWLVLDEADEMLNMGFKEELDTILESTPSSKQVLLFSATMNKSVRRIADSYMSSPKDITVGNKNEGADNVKHYYYVVHERDRYQALRRIADINPDIYGIVFCRTRRETQIVADKLIQDNYSAEAIHGDISQDQRTHVMNRFKNGKIQLLVATDVAARGIDVNKLTHVINYNLPESDEAYVHRSGRTGRANNNGVSLLIMNNREKRKISFLERKVGKKFEQAKVPSGEDICEMQMLNVANRICDVEIKEDQIAKYMDLIAGKFEKMDKDEIIKRFVSDEFNRFIEHYQEAVDLNSGVERDYSGENQRYERNKRNKSSLLFARFNINVGRNDGLNVRDLLDLLNSYSDLKGVEIGNIDLKNSYTLFEIDERYKDKVMKCIQNSDFNGVNVEIICEETGVQSSREDSYRGGGGRNRGGRKNHGYGKSRNQRSVRNNRNSNNINNSKNYFRGSKKRASR